MNTTNTATGNTSSEKNSFFLITLIPYVVIGIYFGIVLTKSEVISWFRIQEMFRFEAFHMYGIIGSAILVGMLSIQIIKRLGVNDRSGKPIVIPPKTLGKGTQYWLGGTIFGLGWALTGACPGPLFALLGTGDSIMFVPILSALVGVFTYGVLKPKLPH